ncbi:hypothetical protein P1X15_08660 [Runella sp. MFBS21]|uniref:hypothetical protein n=1 Tax=Runella sp. MFBS21 TaxID=3034018 RepID=UPI0023FA0CA0|nr:hypothetical protein [Runella sp. MFBS21]MDF7817665.1 hypothetical protein [Runella sp. MFBS21]
MTLTSLLALKAASYEPRSSTAEVGQIQGYYIFVNSKPVKEYKYIGTVKSSMTWGSGQFQDVRDKLIRKAKKEYPDGDGLIFNFYDGRTDKCNVIKIK